MAKIVEQSPQHLVDEARLILGGAIRTPEELAPITRAKVLEALVQSVISRNLEDFRYIADIASLSEKDSKEVGKRVFGRLAFNAPRLIDAGIFPELVWGRNFLPLITFADFPEPQEPVAWSTLPKPSLPKPAVSIHLVLVKPTRHPTEIPKIGFAKLIITWSPLPLKEEDRADDNPWFVYPLSWMASEFSLITLDRIGLARELKRRPVSSNDDSLRHAMYQLAAIDVERVKSARRKYEKETARSSNVRKMFDSMGVQFY